MPRLVSPETRFKRNAEELIEVFSKYFQGLDEDIDMTNLNLAAAYVGGSGKRELVQNFVVNTHKLWDSMFDKNDSSLIDNLTKLAPDRYRKKLKVYIDSATDSEGKILLSSKKTNSAWICTHNMIKCSIYYLNDNKKSFSIEGLKIIELAKKWDIDLEKKVYEETDSDEDDSDTD